MVISDSPMPDLYLGNAVSSDDRDALAFHPRNRRRSDHDDRCQDSRRQFSFVAQGGVMARLLLWELAGQKGNSLGVHSCLATRLSLRGCRSRCSRSASGPGRARLGDCTTLRRHRHPPQALLLPKRGAAC